MFTIKAGKNDASFGTGLMVRGVAFGADLINPLATNPASNDGWISFGPQSSGLLSSIIDGIKHNKTTIAIGNNTKTSTVKAASSEIMGN